MEKCHKTLFVVLAAPRPYASFLACTLLYMAACMKCRRMVD
jgi:hypothetical protein